MPTFFCKNEISAIKIFYYFLKNYANIFENVSITVLTFKAKRFIDFVYRNQCMYVYLYVAFIILIHSPYSNWKKTFI